jgi:hypothetical protein
MLIDVTAAPDPSGRHDDLDGDDALAAELAFLVPDDPRSLDADRDAYFRELAGETLGEPPRQAPFSRAGLSGPLITVLLLVAVLAGSLMTVMAPRNEAIPLPKPLASAPQQPAGHVGGLLPPVTVQVRALEVLVRTVRPAVILVVPAECDGCRASVESVLVQSRTHRLRLVLVGSPAQQDQLADLVTHAAGGQATAALDPSGEIASAYGDGTLTAVIVAQDGIVSSVEQGVTASTQLDADLFNALRAG